MAVIDTSVVTTADDPIPSDDVPSHISMHNVSAYIPSSGGMAINPAPAIEVTSAVHPMEGSPVDAVNAAATEAATAKSSATSGICLRKECGQANFS
jgi:hypothetical protein